jgi:Flp pilus assembly protein TadD
LSQPTLVPFAIYRPDYAEKSSSGAPTSVASSTQLTAAELKEQGNLFFLTKKYKDALSKYTEAIALDKTNAVLFSNRAACYLALKE